MWLYCDPDRPVHEHIEYRCAFHAPREPQPFLQIPGLPHHSTLLWKHHLDCVWYTHHSVTYSGTCRHERPWSKIKKTWKKRNLFQWMFFHNLWNHSVSNWRKETCFEYAAIFLSSLLLFFVQIRKLESTLMDMDNKTLWNDYRIAQPLNDRVVESSFLPRLGKGSMYSVVTVLLHNRKLWFIPQNIHGVIPKPKSNQSFFCCCFF